MAYTDIDDPSAFFQTKIYAGDNASNLVLTFDGNSDLQPDFLWQKQRGGTTDHNLVNSVIGPTFGKSSNTDESEQDNGTAYIKSFQSDGFTIGNSDKVNASSSTNVAWAWKAGTSFTNDASSTSIGATDSAGSFNDTSGFSIVSYTGVGGTSTTIKHGLSTAPKMMIIGNRSADSVDWAVYHENIGNTHRLYLNLTDVRTDAIGTFRDTSPTTAIFTVGDHASVNTSGATYIAYCFAEKQGYSKFGSYIGNGNVNGSYIHLGFKPAFVLIKRAIGDAGEGWSIFDNARSPFNKMLNELRADVASAESTSNHTMEFYSNGFKIPRAGGGINTSGDTHIYMAFAEQPFVTSTGVPATAR